MQTEQIIALLIQERDRLDAAIHALRGSEKRHGRPAGLGRKNATDGFNYNATNVPDWVKPASAKHAAPRKRKLSAAGRKAIVAAAKKRWALIRAGKATSPFAKKGKKTAKG